MQSNSLVLFDLCDFNLSFFFVECLCGECPKRLESVFDDKFKFLLFSASIVASLFFSLFSFVNLNYRVFGMKGRKEGGFDWLGSVGWSKSTLIARVISE
jgi:hypothetical protein